MQVTDFFQALNYHDKDFYHKFYVHGTAHPWFIITVHVSDTVHVHLQE